MVLFGIVFFWTPPHFWALAMRFRDDYAAGRGADAAGGRHAGAGGPRGSSVYTWLTVGTLAAALAAGHRRGSTGWSRWPPAAGSWLPPTACSPGCRRGGPAKPMPLFHLSNSYLAILFVGVAVDALVH